MSVLKFLALCLFLSPLDWRSGVSVVADGQIISVGPLLEEDRFEECVDDLFVGDRNGSEDGNLTRSEYAEFVSLYSNGLLNTTFIGLSRYSLALIALFNHLSCNPSCGKSGISVPGQTVDRSNDFCCAGSTQYVPIWNTTGATESDLFIVCAYANDYIEDAVARFPSAAPSVMPTKSPTSAPSPIPTVTPSLTPTDPPTDSPSTVPSVVPTHSPSLFPTYSPTNGPTGGPTRTPTSIPSVSPSDSPSTTPSHGPTSGPTSNPTKSPTSVFSERPTTSPSVKPTSSPSVRPTPSPIVGPTSSPSVRPTTSPSVRPTSSLSVRPTLTLSNRPTTLPSVGPTSSPSVRPTSSPSVVPTSLPSVRPTTSPSVGPTPSPSVRPTSSPSVVPTSLPSVRPTTSPSVGPTSLPSVQPTSSPSVGPTPSPSVRPTSSPTVRPTSSPSVRPTSSPSVQPTSTAAPSRFGRLEIKMAYGVQTLGHDAAAVIAGDNNTVASDLIVALTTIVVRVLNGKDTCGTEDSGDTAGSPADGTDRELRGILSSPGIRKGREEGKAVSGPTKRRELAEYYPDTPPFHTSVVDVECARVLTEDEGNDKKCIVVTSVVTVFLDAQDDVVTVKSEIVMGIQLSFANGCFLEAIPDPFF